MPHLVLKAGHNCFDNVIRYLAHEFGALWGIILIVEKLIDKRFLDGKQLSDDTQIAVLCGLCTHVFFANARMTVLSSLEVSNVKLGL